MANNNIKISKDAFKAGSVDFQREALFDGIVGINQTLSEYIETHQASHQEIKEDITKLRERKLKDRTFAGVMGLVGGAMAQVMKRVFF